MLKNFINRVKNLVEQNKDNKISTEEKVTEELIENENSDIKEESIQKEELSTEIEENENNIVYNEDEQENKYEIALDKEDISEIINNDYEEINEELDETLNNYIEEVLEEVSVEEIIEEVSDEQLEEDIELTIEDLEYMKEIKIKRSQSIRAIDVYTKEPQIFKTHKECSKKLKVPIEYIQENLKYGNMDYYGEAIKYISTELGLKDKEYENYIESNKTPSQILSNLNNKIFTVKISESKRDDILCNEKIDPIKMHYTFECIDEEYDDYFKKYKSIIKRGGKKKIELVDKKGEVIEIFKSLDDCANFLQKEKEEVVNMLKYKETKVGRNEIRYSLRNI